MTCRQSTGMGYDEGIVYGARFVEQREGLAWLFSIGFLLANIHRQAVVKETFGFNCFIITLILHP